MIWHRKSIRVFFALGFVLPWLGWTTNLMFPTEPPLRTLLFYTGDFMSIAGIVATYAAGGGSAVRALFQRCFARAGLGWWVAAFLLPLVWTVAGRIGYGLTHGGVGLVNFDALSLFFSLSAWRAWTTGPLGEEFGWRGYFLPRLLTAYRPLVATLILGVLWTIWHYPLYARDTFSSPPGASSFAISVICFSILMTIFWFRTRGNLLVAILFHWSVNVSPNVAEALLPHSVPHGAGDSPGGLELWNIGALIVVTLAAGTLFGWKSLGAREEFQVERDLKAEHVTN